MIQQCCQIERRRHLQRALFSTTFPIPDTSGPCLIGMENTPNRNSAVEGLFAGMSDPRNQCQAMRITLVLSGHRELSRPEHDATTGIMMLAYE